MGEPKAKHGDVGLKVRQEQVQARPTDAAETKTAGRDEDAPDEGSLVDGDLNELFQASLMNGHRQYSQDFSHLCEW